MRFVLNQVSALRLFVQGSRYWKKQMAKTNLQITKRDAEIILEILSHLVWRERKQQLIRLIVDWIRSG